uniref:Uncharacterized protein LOC105132076 n=1 Tax=Rhizophora mucronata TaxID=61149 RepID=A0A2P2NH27_RHIMU
MDTLNFDLANFCCLERFVSPFVELGCRGDCLSMPFGRPFADLVRKLASVYLPPDFAKSSFLLPRFEELSVLGTTGAIENRLALKVAIFIRFSSDFRPPNWPFGWTTADPLTTDSYLKPAFVLGSNFPNFWMIILGLERLRIGHRRRRLNILPSILSIVEKRGVEEHRFESCSSCRSSCW